MGPQALPTGTFGPLPQGTVGIILGRSSMCMKGLTIIPGVIDADYEGELKVMVQTSKGSFLITPGMRIAQLLLIPYIPEGKILQHNKRGTGAFGSSDAVYWIQQIGRERPQLVLKINGRPFSGLLDTGADVSVISFIHWPKNWPVHQTITQLQGIGQSNSPQQSSQYLHWQDAEGNQGIFKPYVLPGLPVNLWGRDILQQMGILLLSPNPTVTNILLNQGYDPRNGLGKNQQGNKLPLQTDNKRDKTGLGFF